MRIFINPGHALGGRPDPGAVNCEHGVTEAAINARVAENARIALKRCGYETKVVQSHNLRGEAPGYPNVTGLANSWPADVFVSIHANAGGGRGCETYAFSTHSWGHALATTVQQTLWRAVSRIDKSFPNRGVKVNPDFTSRCCGARPCPPSSSRRPFSTRRRTSSYSSDTPPSSATPSPAPSTSSCAPTSLRRAISFSKKTSPHHRCGGMCPLLYHRKEIVNDVSI